MKTRASLLLALLLVSAFGVGGYVVGAKSWSQQRARLWRIKQARVESIHQMSELNRHGAAVDQSLSHMADLTLGDEQQIVDHRLRARLNRIGEDLRLKQLSVSTGRAVAQTTPAQRRWNRGEKKYRDEIDFVELEGSISGEGTINQALRLIRTLSSEPWLNRIDQVRLEPRSGGERLFIALGLTTIFLPGRAPARLEYPEAAPIDLGPLASLASHNPFRLPAPDEAPALEPGLTQPPEIPWGQWALTGVADGPSGPEAWLTNHTSGESRSLLIGQSLHGASLLAAVGEQAEFQLGQEKFYVLVGHNLDQRTNVPTPQSPHIQKSSAAARSAAP